MVTQCATWPLALFLGQNKNRREQKGHLSSRWPVTVRPQELGNTARTARQGSLNKGCSLVSPTWPPTGPTLRMLLEGRACCPSRTRATSGWQPCFWLSEGGLRLGPLGTFVFLSGSFIFFFLSLPPLIFLCLSSLPPSPPPSSSACPMSLLLQSHPPFHYPPSPLTLLSSPLLLFLLFCPFPPSLSSSTLFPLSPFSSPSGFFSSLYLPGKGSPTKLCFQASYLEVASQVPRPLLNVF